MEKNERLELLKKILLNDEQEVTQSLASEIENLKNTINTPEEFAKKINPIVQSKINNFTKEQLSPLIVSSLKKEIKNSQEAVVEALFPIIGKMIKKYIAHEISLLNERINDKIANAFSFKNLFRAIFNKKQVVNEVFANATKPHLLQILVIEKDSGILVAKHSREDQNFIDEDMLAGMLTAIKSFVEDAFISEEQNLETINYELYTLHIQNFYNYYITAVVSGPYNATIKDLLENKILDFAQNGISKEDINNSEVFTKRLKAYFTNEII